MIMNKMKLLYTFIALLVFGSSVGFIFQSGGCSNVSIVGSIVASGSLISGALVIASLKDV